ncbi:GDP-mannose 3,5-epimerase 2 [Trifolium repens]|nr:GDP-mannose 3,5-epimerase [Trifolium repens]WJX89162.1 GDP-mannose 3,5-epimerase 2 [Trifolium repens]
MHSLTLLIVARNSISGGREKAPAAFCRKTFTSTDKFEMWGDGLQTRSFTFIDECVEGVLRLTKSDFREPVNIGSDEMVSMNEMAEIVLSFENKSIPIQHISGPEGVRGRNSDNTLIKEKLGWAPTMKLKKNEHFHRMSSGQYKIKFLKVFNDSTALTEDDLYELRNCWATCFLDLFNPKNDYDDGAEEGS